MLAVAILLFPGPDRSAQALPGPALGVPVQFPAAALDEGEADQADHQEHDDARKAALLAVRHGGADVHQGRREPQGGDARQRIDAEEGAGLLRRSQPGQERAAGGVLAGD